MTTALRHRGPDDCGLSRLTTAADQQVGAFGHQRLAVLDTTSAGHQPMRSADGRHTLVFNGEIYNFRELRSDLQRTGVKFYSESDTEVLLRGWEKHGRGFIPRLRGMFAFALWDRDSQQAFLARDPFGIKPLYIASVRDVVLFASEIRSLLCSGLVPRIAGSEGLVSYLATGAAEEPATILRDVQMVPAGTWLEIGLGPCGARASRATSYRTEPLASAACGAAETRNEPPEIRRALRDSVAHHLISDVPVGVFLSGGVDSSAIAALAAEVHGPGVDTFTVSTLDRGGGADLIAARAAAHRFGTRHHEVSVSDEDLISSVFDFLGAMDQPTMDGLNTFFVSRAVRNHGIKVVLSGLGGDELFGGYPSFRRAGRIRGLWSLPSSVRDALAWPAACVPGSTGEKVRAVLRERTAATAAYRGSRLLFGARQIRGLTGRTLTTNAITPPADLPLFRQVAWLEFTGYMRNTLLRDSDVFSMAHGLELRVPFVDAAVIESAARVRDPQRGRGKAALVDGFRDLLPREVWDRPKRGFELPIGHWLRRRLRSEVDAAFTTNSLERAGLRPEATRAVWNDFLQGRSGWSWSRPWALFALLWWMESHQVSFVDGLRRESDSLVPVLA